MTHIPGPWIVQETNDFGHTFDIYSEVASTWNGIKYTDDPIALYVKYRSNAALIAAAPDLLATCITILQKASALADDYHTWIYNTDDGQELMRLVREIEQIADTAIAKVKGK